MRARLLLPSGLLRHLFTECLVAQAQGSSTHRLQGGRHREASGPGTQAFFLHPNGVYSFARPELNECKVEVLRTNDPTQWRKKEFFVHFGGRGASSCVMLAVTWL